MPLMFVAFLAAAAQQPATSPFQMTTAEVQKCGSMAADRAHRIAELKERDAALMDEQTKLTERQTQLTEMATKVNTKKPKDVAAFNALSAAFNTDIAAHHDKVTARNAFNAEIPAVVDAYNRDCTHRSMNPADIAALPEDQRALMTANATTSTIMVPGKPVPAPSRRRR